VPELPTDFPLTNERVALGKRLFNEKRLSRNNSQACASCHKPDSGFSDSRRFSRGAIGGLTKRNAMPLCNLAWKKAFFWDGRAPSLRVQALQPIQDPNEMHESLDRVVSKLERDSSYRADFKKAFGTAEITAEKAGIALEAFVLTLTSFDSKFDRAMHGAIPLTEQEKRGFQLFVTEYDPRQNQFGADCFHCHGGTLFTDNQFHNNGLPSTGPDAGRVGITRSAPDQAKFSTPSLRNVAITGPYMHDGRFQTLDQVIDHYDHGVVPSETLDPNLAKHPRAGLNLSAEDKKALVAFLKTLTEARLAATRK
jgi:cytochrome c peroxidase